MHCSALAALKLVHEGGESSDWVTQHMNDEKYVIQRSERRPRTQSYKLEKGEFPNCQAVPVDGVSSRRKDIQAWKAYQISLLGYVFQPTPTTASHASLLSPAFCAAFEEGDRGLKSQEPFGHCR
jgi:hypothetical protein